jgi:hypothetical protein
MLLNRLYPSALRGTGLSPINLLSRLTLSPTDPFAAPIPRWTGRERLEQTAFARYGGFQSRPVARATPDLGLSLNRRQELLRATKSIAPIRRAITQGSNAPLRSSIRSPFFEVATANELPTENAPHLEDALRLDNEKRHAEVRRTAWARFADGQFFLAAKGFGLASRTDTTDLESRIGELASELMMGSGAAPAVIVEDVWRRFDDPFTLDLKLAERLGSQPLANQLRTRARVYVQIEGADAHLAAAYTLILWYLGERQDAVRAATALARRFPESRFDGWAERMRSAAPLGAPSGNP